MEGCKTPKYPLRCNYSHVPIWKWDGDEGWGFDSRSIQTPLFFIYSRKVDFATAMMGIE